MAGCGGDQAGSPAASGATLSTTATLSNAAQLGKTLFFDTQLSASGRQSCGTCHVPTLAYTANPQTDQGLPVPLGGPNMDLPGFRNTPSLMYASFTPPFSLTAGGAVGGFFRDGRASSLAAQAQQPFLTAFEMANTDAAALQARLQQQPEWAQVLALYGPQVASDAQLLLQDVGLAIAAYETEDPSFHPFSSKYDFWLAGQATLSAAEQRGLTLFNDPVKGNCNACHPSQAQGFSSHPLFTDFSFDSIGIPRNWGIAANLPDPSSPISGVPLTYLPAPLASIAGAEYGYYDLGLCGPFEPFASDVLARPALDTSTSLCGVFKVPTLRNVAVTAPYFHNGEFPTLKQVLEWYVTRDINNNPGNNPTPVDAGVDGNPYVAAGSFYLAADGTPDLYEYNDLPPQYDANVNIGEVPYTPPSFAGGQAPTLTESDIDDIVAFLCTLTDGFDPANPAAYALPAQCSGPAAP
jgi:cytochrome c peroxidase